MRATHQSFVVLPRVDTLQSYTGDEVSSRTSYRTSCTRRISPSLCSRSRFPSHEFIQTDHDSSPPRADPPSASTSTIPLLPFPTIVILLAILPRPPVPAGVGISTRPGRTWEDGRILSQTLVDSGSTVDYRKEEIRPILELLGREELGEAETAHLISWPGKEARALEGGGTPERPRRTLPRLGVIPRGQESLELARLITFSRARGRGGMGGLPREANLREGTREGGRGERRSRRKGELRKGGGGVSVDQVRPLAAC